MQKFLSKMISKIFKDYRFVTILWLGLILATIIQNVIIHNQFNNYLIFEGVFWHTIKQISLYAEYPLEYFDKNHYGIVFSAIVAPFAILPKSVGSALWILGNAAFLFWAIRQLPLKKESLIAVLLISAHDLYTASAMQQFNTSIIALLVAAFVFIHKGKDHWATLFIALGIFTKLYGVVGLAFFFFSENKLRFIFWGFFWSVVLFLLPMIYSSPEFVISQYQQWFEMLLKKNQSNLGIQYNLQNLSLLGFLQRTGIYSHNLSIIATALVLFLLPYLRFSQYKNLAFRLMFLASVSLFLVLFSTGTENSTYIIGYVGIGLWFAASPNKNKVLKISLLIFAIMGSLSPTDLIPKSVKWDYVIKYSLRAVPVAIIWLTMLYEMYFLNYSQVKSVEK